MMAEVAGSPVDASPQALLIKAVAVLLLTYYAFKIRELEFLAIATRAPLFTSVIVGSPVSGTQG